MFTKIQEIRDECPLCEGVRDLVYGSQIETIRVRGEDISVETKLYYCLTGDHYFQSAHDDEERIQNAYKEYRKRKGLIQPDEIKQLRERYGLSQRAFARLLNWGTITIQRYETGAIQDSAHDSILRFLNNSDNFRRYYESMKSMLQDINRNKVEKKLAELEKQASQLVIDFALKRAFANVVKIDLTKYSSAKDSVNYKKNNHYDNFPIEMKELSLAA